MLFKILPTTILFYLALAHNVISFALIKLEKNRLYIYIYIDTHTQGQEDRMNMEFHITGSFYQENTEKHCYMDISNNTAKRKEAD
jgi:hypothetical protein